jgi:hypothetical protein
MQARDLAHRTRLRCVCGSGSRAHPLRRGVCVRVCVQLDYGQLKLVFDALHERLHMLRAAPHLTSAVPIMMPCYKLWEARTRTRSATASKMAPTAPRAADAHAYPAPLVAGALLLGGAEGVRPCGGHVRADVVALRERGRVAAAVPHAARAARRERHAQGDGARRRLAAAAGRLSHTMPHTHATARPPRPRRLCITTARWMTRASTWRWPPRRPWRARRWRTTCAAWRSQRCCHVTRSRTPRGPQPHAPLTHRALCHAPCRMRLARCAARCARMR